MKVKDVATALEASYDVSHIALDEDLDALGRKKANGVKNAPHTNTLFDAFRVIDGKPDSAFVSTTVM